MEGWGGEGREKKNLFKSLPSLNGRLWKLAYGLWWVWMCCWPPIEFCGFSRDGGGEAAPFMEPRPGDSRGPGMLNTTTQGGETTTYQTEWQDVWKETRRVTKNTNRCSVCHAVDFFYWLIFYYLLHMFHLLENWSHKVRSSISFTLPSRAHMNLTAPPGNQSTVYYSLQ